MPPPPAAAWCWRISATARVSPPYATATASTPAWDSLLRRGPMIVLASPKGWTGPKFIDGRPNEGTFRSHQVPLTDPATNPAHLKQLEEAWKRCFKPRIV